jgi:hypothetical protein
MRSVIVPTVEIANVQGLIVDLGSKNGSGTVRNALNPSSGGGGRVLTGPGGLVERAEALPSGRVSNGTVFALVS